MSGDVVGRVLLVGAVLVTVGALWHAARTCRDRGGVPVRGLVWVVCVPPTLPAAAVPKRQLSVNPLRDYRP